MKLFRTNNGFIFEGEAEIGHIFIHESQTRLDEKDEVICVGECLKDLIQIGDIIEYNHSNTHGQWLLEINSEKAIEDVKKSSFSVDKIFHKLGNVYVESVILPREYTKKEFWNIGDLTKEAIKMNKKITPLEALNNIKNLFIGSPINPTQQFEIIETALKNYEKKTKLAKEYKDVNNVAKRLHAFTLLDDCDIDIWLIKHCDYENYCRVRTLCLKTTGNADVDDANREVINLPTEKEFDFLKEILK